MTMPFNDCLKVMVNGHVKQVMALMEQIEAQQDVPADERHRRKSELWYVAMTELKHFGFTSAERHHNDNSSTKLQAPIPLRTMGPTKARDRGAYER